MTDPIIPIATAPDRSEQGRLTVSLSEVDAMSRKATRGAGYAWGLAEEAGYAIRWLASYGFDGLAMLLNILKKVDRIPSFLKNTYLTTGF